MAAMVIEVPAELKTLGDAMVEALAAVILGTQGDRWDRDMFSALIGAIAAQLPLARTQDRQLAALQGRADRVVGRAA